MKNNSNKKQSVKLVMVEGILVPADKAEGRRKALERGRNLKIILIKDQAKQEKQLADEGYSPEEITCMRHANRIQTLERMGLGTPNRVRRTYVPA